MAKPRDLANSVNAGGIPASNVTAASTSAAGVVQLNDTTSSTSTSQAATANAAKAAYDRGTTGVNDAATALSIANAAMPKTGGTFTNAVVFQGNATLASLNGDCLAGFRNRIINGGMRVCQRAISTTVNASNAAGIYTLDRWRAINDTDGNFTVVQSSDAPSGQGLTNSLLVTIVTADAALAATQRASIQQRIEGSQVMDVGLGTATAKTILLSFWVKASVTGFYGLSVRNAASGATRSYNTIYQVSTANTWEKKTILIPGDTTGTWSTGSGVGMNLTWSLGCGSSAVGTDFWTNGDTDGGSGVTARPIQTASATWQLAGAQLEVAGSAATGAFTPFERRPMGLEMLLCQRYFWKSYNQDSSPSTVTTPGQFVAVSNANGTWRITVPFKVTMRDTPTTITSYSPTTGAAGTYRDDTLGNDRASTLVSSGMDGASFSGVTAAYATIRFHATAEAEL